MTKFVCDDDCEPISFLIVMIFHKLLIFSNDQRSLMKSLNLTMKIDVPFIYLLRSLNLQFYGSLNSD